MVTDADVVIEANRIGLWKAMIAAYEVLVPETVARQEVRFFSEDDGETVERIPITRLPGVRILSATAELMTQTARRLGQRAGELGTGETEALALFAGGELPEGCRFCTGDGLALVTFCQMDFGPAAISLEELLAGLGAPGAKMSDLRPHFRRRALVLLKTRAASEPSI